MHMTVNELNLKYQTNLPQLLLPEEVGNPRLWESQGRPRLKEILQKAEYGTFPQYDRKNTTFAVQESEKVLGMDAWRKQIAITTHYGDRSHTFTAYLFTPLGKENVPVFLYINRLEWMRRCVIRGTINQRLPIEEIIARGYGLIFFCTEEVSSEMLDTHIDYRKGLHDTLGIDSQAEDNLGSIGLWAFAAMRIMDYLETEPSVDASRVAVVGHSRLGKTALVAGAFDERFAITISNNSGAGGAALFKTKVGEHTEYMVETIPYWFCNRFKTYYRAEERMPYDQHFLLALAAPRPLYVASAQLDEWSDPLAEFSAASLASQVYEQVYGIAGLNTAQQPPLDTPVQSGNIGYHVRTGPHNILKYDWNAFMDFADRYFK